ncbi:hypothetical protein N5E15_22080 [Pantoea stewartii]|uniref:hypothetical protein n=1 Tax=Pantoea stewartii TaxID=66269 RepID=UPI0021D50EE6|nr:hypothetical protein [Pantoea stewartii]MCU7369268.1 hypothetical protein [Pantoea stewartii]
MLRLFLAELTAFNYDQRFIDQRTTPPHETTYHAFLGERYFQHLDALKALSAKDEVRILFRFVG